MVKLFLLFMLLAGCAVPVPLAVVVPEPEPVIVEEKQQQPKRVVKTPAPVIIVVPTLTKPLPPCESVPGDKKAAILQKLECLKQTADLPVPPPK